MAKDKTAAKTKKPGFFAKRWQSVKDMRSEMKKVVWPTKSQLVNNTIVVLVMMLLVGVFIWLMDWGLGALVSLIFKTAS